MNIQKKVILSGSVFFLLVAAAFVSEKLQSSGRKIATGLFFPEFIESEVYKISVGDSQNGVILTKKGSEWRVVNRGSNADFLADKVKVNALLDKVKIMQKEQLLSENEANQKAMGVTEETGISVLIQTENGEELNAFIIGNKSANWRLSNVRKKGSDQVFQVSGSIRFAFKTELADWRERGIFRHPADSMVKIEIPGQLVLEKVEAIGEIYWSVKSGEKEARAYQPTVDRYLKSLASFVANDWAVAGTPETVWRGPNGGVSAIVTLANGETETITVGIQDPSGRNRFFVKNSVHEDLFFVVGSGAQVPFITFEYLVYDPVAAKAVQDSSTISSNGTADGVVK